MLNIPSTKKIVANLDDERKKDSNVEKIDCENLSNKVRKIRKLLLDLKLKKRTLLVGVLCQIENQKIKKRLWKIAYKQMMKIIKKKLKIKRTKEVRKMAQLRLKVKN